MAVWPRPGRRFYSPYISNVDYYGEGHYLIHSGGIAYDKEGNPSEVLGTLAKVNGCHMYSVTVELMDGKQMLKMQVPGNYYRAVKLPLYKKGANLTLGPGKLLGSMGITRRSWILSFRPHGSMSFFPIPLRPGLKRRATALSFTAPSRRDRPLSFYWNRETRCTATTFPRRPSSTRPMCCGTFLEEDGRKAKLSVNKVGPLGSL